MFACYFSFAIDIEFDALPTPVFCCKLLQGPVILWYSAEDIVVCPDKYQSYYAHR